MEKETSESTEPTEREKAAYYRGREHERLNMEDKIEAIKHEYFTAGRSMHIDNFYQDNDGNSYVKIKDYKYKSLDDYEQSKLDKNKQPA